MNVKFGFGVLALGMCCLTGAGAQTTDGSGNLAGAGVMVSPAKALDEMLSAFEGQAMGAAKAMPAEKYNFAPSAAAFAPGSPAKFDTVRTFAQQVSHLAQANYYFYMTVSGLKPDVDTKAIGIMKTKEELVAALESSFVFGHKALTTVTAANAFESIKGADGLHTRATVADFAVAHGYDHYGQMAEYLRMNGIVPPGSK